MIVRGEGWAHLPAVRCRRVENIVGQSVGIRDII